MSVVVASLLLCVVAYLLGAVPSAYLVGRVKGLDIRKVGSGNVGATNVFRAVGKGWGVLTFVADAAKGFVPAFAFPLLTQRLAHVPETHPALPILFAALAIVGHNWPVYLRFKGGKGVATTAGALMGLAPAAAGLGLLVWAAVFLGSRYVSVASLTAAIVVPAAAWARYGRAGLILPAALTLLGLLIIWRHKGNIQRLRAGTEHRFEFKARRSRATKPSPP
jgi:acyl phosphate:glycerol-3-phosphate acyltransferase